MPTLRVLALLTLFGSVVAQEIQPVAPQAQPTAPLQVEPVAVPTTVPTVPAATAPAKLDGVSATLTAPRNASTTLTLTLTLSSKLNKSTALAVGRDNGQNCATAPLIRVLRVGTREVIYPVAGASPKLCTQDLKTDVLGAGGSVTYSREIQLPAGDYVVEGWWQGFADNLRAKVSATAVRVTVN